MKTCLFIPYFGKLPLWFDFFLKSCENNKEYDFYIYTDDTEELYTPDNVIIKRTSLKIYSSYLLCNLGLEEYTLSYSKLCDFRPFLYYIHNDIVKNYDYWGYCDLDLVFGDLSKFFAKHLENKVVSISTHADRFSGHFSLFSVDSYDSRLSPFKIKNWKELLIDNKHLAIDEEHFAFCNINLYRVLGNRIGRRLLKTSLSRTYGEIFYGKNMVFEELYTTPLSSIRWWDGSSAESHPTEWEWCNGKVFAKNDNFEVPYLHFMNFKKSGWNLVPPLWDKKTVYEFNKKSNNFLINGNGIFSLT